MKICTVTFHRAENFGALLQAYALQTAIELLTDQRCSVLDYRCTAIENSYKRFMVQSKSLKGIVSAFVHYPVRFIRKEKFSAFRDNYLNVTEKIYDSGNVAQANNDFDIFIAGSDQVWNTNLTDNDTNYFLSFVKEGKKKCSYAASFGRTEFTREESEKYKLLLSDFDKISLREQESCLYVQDLIGKSVRSVIDPVFLLSKSQWEEIISPRPIKQPYIFLYELHENTAREYAQALSEKTGMKILTIPNDLRGKIAGQKHYAPSVNDFLGYIYYASHVVTDSFHVTAFSLLFEKDLVPVLQRENPGMNGRIASLLDSLQQHDSILIPEKTDFSEIKKIDYSVATPILNTMIEDSKKYLQSVCTER